MSWKGWDANTISLQEDEIQHMIGLLRQCLPIIKRVPLVGPRSLSLPDMTHAELCTHIFALVKDLEAELREHD